MRHNGPAAGKTAAPDEDGAQTTFIVAGDDAEILDDGDDEDISEVETDVRPDGCQCWDEGQDLSCWPCHRAGFRTPNPDTPAVTEVED